MDPGLAFKGLLSCFSYSLASKHSFISVWSIMGLLSSLQFVRSGDRNTGEARPGVSIAGAETLLAAFPGPAFVLNGDLETVLSNESAAPVIAAFRDRKSGKFASAVRQVQDTLTPDHQAFTYGEGDDLEVVDLTLLPMAGAADHILVTGKNVTMQRNLTNALVASRQLFKDLVTCTAEFVWETDQNGRFRYVSPRGAIGFTAAELDGRIASSLILPSQEQDESKGDDLNPFESREPVTDQIVWLRDRSEALACMRISSIPVFDEDGTWTGCRGAGHDITGEMAQRTRLEKLAAEEKVFSQIIDAIRQEIDPAKLFEIAGRGACDALNSTRILLGRKNMAGSFEVLFRTGLEEQSEKAIMAWFREAGETAGYDAGLIEWTEGDWKLFISPILSGDRIDGVIALVRRKEATRLEEGEERLLRLLSEHLGVALIQIKAREKLEHLSRTDELSGLLNRRAFHEDVVKRLRHNLRSGVKGALFYIDLDNFKPVNDRFGHEKGDEVLIGISRLLSKTSRVGDMVARLGGDEFAMWLEDISLDEAVDKAKILQVQCAEVSEELEVRDPALSFSIGIAMSSGDHEETLDDLLARADAAMYEVKAKGKGTFSVAGEVEKEGREDA